MTVFSDGDDYFRISAISLVLRFLYKVACGITSNADDASFKTIWDQADQQVKSMLPMGHSLISCIQFLSTKRALSVVATPAFRDTFVRENPSVPVELIGGLLHMNHYIAAFGDFSHAISALRDKEYA